MTRRAERRGSIQQYTPSQWYKDTLKGSILHTVGAEGQSAVIQVYPYYSNYATSHPYFNQEIHHVHVCDNNQNTDDFSREAQCFNVESQVDAKASQGQFLDTS